jgi:uncharacterized membrane protein YoaK (UPF0700 family)
VINVVDAPNNYSQYINVVFTENMSGWDFLTNSKNFYTALVPEAIFWCIILSIPYLSMYQRQDGILIVAIFYLFTGSIIAAVMPAFLGKFAMWFLVLGTAGIIYKVFIKR